MNAHPALHSWAVEWTASRPAFQARPMFGSPAWFLEGKLRLCVIGSGVALKGTPETVALVCSQCPWAGPFFAHGRTMGPNWVFLTPPDLERTTELSTWAEVILETKLVD